MQLQRFASNPVIPNEWKKQEKKRLAFSCYVTLQQCSKALALPIERPSKIESMEDWAETTITGLKGIVETVAKEFHRAVDEVKNFRDWEEKSASTPEEKKTSSRSRFGHDRALSALEQGEEQAKCALKLVEDLGTGDQIIKSLQDLQDILIGARQRVRSILQPAENFLSSVLDHELAAATLGHDSTWEPHQVAFAASSLGIIDKRWREDKRLPEALGYLTRAISDRGRFPIGQPFHGDKSAMHFIYPGFVTTALAELLRNVRYPEVEPNLVKKMLHFFDDTRVRQAGIDKETRDLEKKRYEKQEDLERDGWFNEYDMQGRRFKPWATVAAVCGLAAINRMLDERINQLILAHFRVKKPERDINLDLDALFYPDYGVSLVRDPIEGPETGWLKVSLFDESEWPQDCWPTESVAVTLQKIHAHVRRVHLDESGPHYCSVVLHGPPGTGKTTLVEALAKSCGASLVEVTPSDIIVGGEEAIERRARAVFEALNLLTRVVILFDEFDPVLWRRDPNDATQRSMFTFLTPGMLPKLKDLHRCAEKRAFAYVLSTNLIGGLDDAAVREGRFDKKIGIYPPDALSRAGRLLNHVAAYLEKKEVQDYLKSKHKCDPNELYGLKESAKDALVVINSSKGGSMETLAKPEWFTAPDPTKVKVEQSLSDAGEKLKPFAYIFSRNDKKKCKDAEREAHLTEPVGQGKTAIREFIQWWWIDRWDKKIAGSTANLNDSLEQYPDLTREVKDLYARLRDWKKKGKTIS